VSVSRHAPLAAVSSNRQLAELRADDDPGGRDVWSSQRMIDLLEGASNGLLGTSPRGGSPAGRR
jgi:hypothetical protein